MNYGVGWRRNNGMHLFSRDGVFLTLPSRSTRIPRIHTAYCDGEPHAYSQLLIAISDEGFGQIDPIKWKHGQIRMVPYITISAIDFIDSLFDAGIPFPAWAYEPKRGSQDTLMRIAEQADMQDLYHVHIHAIDPDDVRHHLGTGYKRAEAQFLKRWGFSVDTAP